MTAIAEPTLDERYQDSLQALEESQREIQQLRKEFADYQQATGLVLEDSLPRSFATSAVTGGLDVYSWLAGYKRRDNEAQARFQHRLSVWAGLRQEVKRMKPDDWKDCPNCHQPHSMAPTSTASRCTNCGFESAAVRVVLNSVGRISQQEVTKMNSRIRD